MSSGCLRERSLCQARALASGKIFIVSAATLKFIRGMEALLDSKQLRAYLCLARHGSFTKAARELGLSQSAVSHAMKALELDVGCRLLDRTGKKVALTQAGEQLLSHAEKIQCEMASARQGLTASGTCGQLRLRVAAPASFCQHVLRR